MQRHFQALIIAQFVATSCTADPVVTFSPLTQERVAVQIDHQSFIGDRIDITNNKVGLPATEACVAVKLDDQEKENLMATTGPITSNYIIFCQNRAPITDVTAKGGSATGTPGYIMWKTSYIGTLYHPITPAQEGVAGASRRTVFCLGASQ